MQAQIISHPQKSQYIGKYLSQPIIDFSNQLRVLLVLVLVKMQTPENCFSCGGNIIAGLVILLLHITISDSRSQKLSSAGRNTLWILLPSYCENYKFRQLVYNILYYMQAINEGGDADALRQYSNFYSVKATESLELLVVCRVLPLYCDYKKVQEKTNHEI